MLIFAKSLRFVEVFVNGFLSFTVNLNCPPKEIIKLKDLLTSNKDLKLDEAHENLSEILTKLFETSAWDEILK